MGSTYKQEILLDSAGVDAMPRLVRTTGQPNGHPREIPEPLRELIWKLYHERLSKGRTRSLWDVAQWLDEHDIPAPRGGYWRKSTVQYVLERYRHDKELREDKEYDVLIKYEEAAKVRAAKVNPRRRIE